MDNVMYHQGYADNQPTIELTIQSYIKTLSSAQKTQVLEFIEYLQFKNQKTPTHNNQADPSLPISHYAGMIKLPQTGVPRSLFDFDVASMAKDE